MPGDNVTVEHYPGEGYWEAVVEAHDAQGMVRVLRPRGKDWDEIWLKANEAYRSIVSPPEAVNEKPAPAESVPIPTIPSAEDEGGEFLEITPAGVAPKDEAAATYRPTLSPAGMSRYRDQRRR